MATLTLTQVTLEELARLVPIEANPLTTAPWEDFEANPLTPDQDQQLAWLVARIRTFHTTRANESTLWARAIYPMLVLAERDDVRAWSQVGLRATFESPDGTTDLVGIADGVLARESGLGGEARPPFLLVVEAKRAVDATDPAPQLLGAIFIALQLDRRDQTPRGACFGCYTVGDTWTFARATLALEGTSRRVVVDWSREYTERNEASAILRILTAIVGQTTRSPAVYS